ncbi:MAG: hypothetical protein ACI31G_00900 [Bacilli bacterium]
MNEFKTDINRFLINNAEYIALAIALIIVLALLIIFILIGVQKNKNSKNNNEQNNLVQLVKCFGGIENIEKYELKGSRFSFVIKDNSLVNKEEIKNYGVSSIILMSNKLTIVCDKSKELLSYLDSIMSK